MTKVMLVEDHPAFRQALAFTLDRELGVEVAQAGSLSEARRLLAMNGVDVVVVDLGLPDGDGTELVKELPELSPDSSVLVLTAFVESGAEAALALETGVAEVLHKSAGIHAIVGAVKRLAAA